jgi:hypothetical protein
MIEACELERCVTGDERLLRDVGVSDFLKPAWGLLRQRRIGWVTYNRFVWCDECLQRNCHGLHEEEEVAGRIIERYPHCECRIGSLIYSMGMAEGELAKMLQRYPSSRMMYTPPPLRRVYAEELVGVGTELDLNEKKPSLPSGVFEADAKVAV